MKNMANRLIKVMEECSIVRKNGINDFHHYKYATSADVLEKVNVARGIKQYQTRYAK